MANKSRAVSNQNCASVDMMKENTPFGVSDYNLGSIQTLRTVFSAAKTALRDVENVKPPSYVKPNMNLEEIFGRIQGLKSTGSISFDLTFKDNISFMPANQTGQTQTFTQPRAVAARGGSTKHGVIKNKPNKQNQLEKKTLKKKST